MTAINTDTSSVSGSLQTVVSYVDYAGSYEVRTFPARNVTIPSGQSVVETYTFEQADYEWNGEFMVAATLNDTQGEASFTINDGLDVQFDVPETIAQGGTLPVSLYITNTLDTSISNVEVEVFFPPIIEEFNAPVQITIPGLTPGESYIESWNITPAEAGLQQIVTSVASMDAGNDQATASFEVQGWASLGVVLNVTETVTPGIPFDVVAQISNNGGQIATNTEVVLSLSEHLTTTDPLIIPIGNLEAEAMQEVTWSITADAAGTHTVLVEINETSVSDQETASQLVNAVEYAHRIQLTSSREQIAGRAPVMLTLTLENFGTIEDQISLDIASTNPTIGFTAYTDNQPLTGPVTVPAQSTAAFNLQITPHVWERGTVTIKAVSELDPTAVDYISIPVDGYVTSADNFVFLPLVIR